MCCARSGVVDSAGVAMLKVCNTPASTVEATAPSVVVSPHRFFSKLICSHPGPNYDVPGMHGSLPLASAAVGRVESFIYRTICSRGTGLDNDSSSSCVLGFLRDQYFLATHLCALRWPIAPLALWALEDPPRFMSSCSPRAKPLHAPDPTNLPTCTTLIDRAWRAVGTIKYTNSQSFSLREPPPTPPPPIL